ncbi:MAG: hypothetical protein L3J43_10310 [Sulfurovum sp.]|nr:hypothetical protein [Sulfurovum sp.]
MNKIGLSLDYSNICKDYNTVYLDRDNTDRETFECMNKVMEWFKPLLLELLEEFKYNLYRLNQEKKLKPEEIVQKRFFFYSLEKEIIAQTFILKSDDIVYESLADWAVSDTQNILIQNDDEGEGLYFYFTENSTIHHWLLEKFKAYSIDIIPFDKK